MGVSAVVLARDEAVRIAKCLDTLKWCDEIVVLVDDASKDETESIARQYTPHVSRRAFSNFGEQRRFADSLASHEWVLSIDCDEVVSAALAAEVSTTIAQPKHAGYRVPHMDYMFGRWIRHGGWFPQYHTRLYRRSSAKWERTVHELLVVDGSLGTLREPIQHFAHVRVDDWVRKMARYTSAEAEAHVKMGERTSLLRALLEPPGYFIFKYILQRGFLDGAHGLALACLLTAYRSVMHWKWWDLQQNQQGPKESPDCPPRM
ncbi:MAG: glycosyltransferase family 2 protein [Candidatus Eisenbacteria bacterium]